MTRMKSLNGWLVKKKKRMFVVMQKLRGVNVLEIVLPLMNKTINRNKRSKPFIFPND